MATVRVNGIDMGASVVLRLAAAHPDLVASVCAHEPAGIALFAQRRETRPLFYELTSWFLRAFDAIEREPERGMRELAETVAPGLWDAIPAEQAAQMIANSKSAPRRHRRWPGERSGRASS